MCLALPMKLVEIRADGKGLAELDGCRHVVDLSLVNGVCPGAYLIVHAGYAIETLDQESADSTLSLFEEMAKEVASETRRANAEP